MKHAKGRCFAVALATVMLSGCSVGAPEKPATPPQAAAKTHKKTDAPSQSEVPVGKFLDQNDVKSEPDGSARQALYALWFAVQYRDMLTAYDLMSSEFRRDFAGSFTHFSEFVMADYQRWGNKPKVLFSTKTRQGESVAITYRPPGGAVQRFAMTFRRESGRWKLAYDFYLAQRLSAK